MFLIPKRRHAGISLFLVLICSGASLLMADEAQTQNVPGVDAIPTARQSAEQETRKTDQGNQDTENPKVNTIADTNTNNTAQNTLALPLIRNLSVAPATSRPWSMRLTWEVDPANTTGIYIARYVRPLQSRDLVLDADVVNTTPLDPKATEFIDYNIPDGTWYYVVVTSYEVSNAERLKLQAGVNYSTNPAVIYRNQNQDKPEDSEQEHRFAVQGIYAVDTDSSVVLSWVPAPASDIVYNVYKSYYALGSPDDIKLARRVAVLDEKTLRYEDKEAIVGRKTWYCISVTRKSDQREFTLFKPEITTTAHKFVQEKVSVDRLRLIPENLTVYLQSANAIKLLWSDPEQSVPDLAIYRSSRPISSVQALQGATWLGNVKYGVKQWQDQQLKPGTYYYAVLPRKEQRKLIGIFIAGKTFSSFGVQIHSQPNVNTNTTTDTTQTNTNVDSETNNTNTTTDTSETDTAVAGEKPRFSRFNAEPGGQGRVRLTWGFNNLDKLDPAADWHVLLYRSSRPIRATKNLQETADFIEEFSLEEAEYLDQNLAVGKYYYALVLDQAGVLDSTLIVGRNLLRSPVVIKSKDNPSNNDQDHVQVDNNTKPQPHQPAVRRFSMAELNKVLARTWHQKKYSAALREIAPFVQNPSTDPRVKSRALLYTGLSWYELGRYRAALEYFLDPRTRRYYPERSRFWYDRTIEKIR
ncbi:MAG: hypothetical protein KDK39_13050 [Leptospiraceae bacterium]|nr:hypothetical protein [Leptospiraceae bacterium]